MSTQVLEQAIAASRSTLVHVSADQLGGTTPCASWNVAELVNHMIGVLDFFASGATKEMSADAVENPADGDFLAAFDTAAARCISAYNTPGVAESMITLPFGTMPGSAVIGLAATDCFTHGWDVAKATGQSTDLDPVLAGQLLAGAHQSIQEAFRGADTEAPFGPVQQAPDDATGADQLAAFLGRSL